MRFEKPQDIARENKAIKTLAAMYGWTYKKLGPNDVDFYIEGIGYLEVKGRLRNISEAYPLPLSEAKYKKLSLKPLNSIIVWACLDGLIYADLSKLKYTSRMGGRAPRKGSSNDQEQMYYIGPQPALKTLRNASITKQW